MKPNCPKCQSKAFIKIGRNKSGFLRVYCLDCGFETALTDEEYYPELLNKEPAIQFYTQPIKQESKTMDDKRIETLKVLCDILLGTRNLDGKHTRDSVHHMMQLCREYPKETCEAVGMLQSFIYELGHNSHPDEWMFESKEDCK